MDKNTAADILAGAVLSDGSLTASHGVGNRYFSIGLSGTKHLDWLLEIKSALLTLGIGITDTYPKEYQSVSKGKPYIVHKLCSRTSRYLTVMADSWYVNGQKEVPEDFTLSVVSLAHWFMGDGSSFYGNPGSVFALLCTHGLNMKSVEVLERELKRLGINDIGRNHSSKVVKGSGTGISIRLGSIQEFMMITDPYVLPSFKYKVKFGGDLC